jgi:hypothetical protein
VSKKKPHRKIEREWSIAELPLPTLGQRGIKSLLRHPLSPILLAVLLSGISPNLLSILVGLGIVTVWVAVDLWPFANFASVWLVNRMSFTQKRPYPKFLPVIDRYRADLECNRRKVNFGLHAIIFTAICGLIILADAPLVRFVVERHLKKEMIDVYSGLHALSASEDENRGQAILTVKNDSSYHIHVTETRCFFNQFDTTDNSFINIGTVLFKGDQPLFSGGDGLSFNCPGNFLGPFTLVCADITWVVFYDLEEDQKRPQGKGFRYVLLPGKTEWEQQPLTLSVSPCSRAER